MATMTEADVKNWLRAYFNIPTSMPIRLHEETPYVRHACKHLGVQMIPLVNTVLPNGRPIQTACCAGCGTIWYYLPVVV